MLMPRRTKYRKQFRGKRRGQASRGNSVQFGDYGMQSLAPAWLTSRQIEAARRAVVRYVKRGGRVVIRVFPDKPVTQKAAETRMGSGKGAVDHWVAVVRPGTILFEIAGVTAATKDPNGGVFRRREGSQEPNGVLEEVAHMNAIYKLMKTDPTADISAELKKAAGL